MFLSGTSETGGQQNKGACSIGSTESAHGILAASTLFRSRWSSACEVGRKGLQVGLLREMAAGAGGRRGGVAHEEEVGLRGASID